MFFYASWFEKTCKKWKIVWHLVHNFYMIQWFPQSSFWGAKSLMNFLEYSQFIVVLILEYFQCTLNYHGGRQSTKWRNTTHKYTFTYEICEKSVFFCVTIYTANTRKLTPEPQVAGLRYSWIGPWPHMKNPSKIFQKLSYRLVR